MPYQHGTFLLIFCEKFSSGMFGKSDCLHATKAKTSYSAISRLNAWMTVVRDRPSSSASVRVAGRRSPPATAPDSISSRSAAYSCVVTGRAEAWSIAMDWQRTAGPLDHPGDPPLVGMV